MDLLWKERKRIWCGLPLTFTVYSYDNERFYVKSGFLNQRQDEVRLYRIQDLTVTRSLSQRIFGMGTILVNSSCRWYWLFYVLIFRFAEGSGRSVANSITKGCIFNA